jgi:hypothetical protein
MAEQAAAATATPMDTAPMADAAAADAAAATAAGGGDAAPSSSSAPAAPPVDPVLAAEQARLQEAHDAEVIELAREVRAEASLHGLGLNAVKPNRPFGGLC